MMEQAEHFVATRKRHSLASMAVRLLIGLTAILVLLSIFRDVRRKHEVVKLAEQYAAALSTRMGETGALPLLLEPHTDRLRRTRTYRFEWLSPDDARRARSLTDPIIVAQSVPHLRFWGDNGRAVVLFDGGRFRVEWMDLSEFDRRIDEQNARLRAAVDAAVPGAGAPQAP